MFTHNSTKAYKAGYLSFLNRRKARWIGVLVGTVSALAMLTACDAPQPDAPPPAPPEQMLVYKTMDECKAAQDDDKLCEKAFAEAWQWQEQQSGYTGKQQCEAEFGAGNCESRANPSGGNWFVPLMAGFMMSSAMNRRSQYPSEQEREQEQQGGAYPVYINRQGNVSSYGGGRLRPMGYQVSPTTGALPRSMMVQRDPSGHGYVARSTYSSADSRLQPSSRGGFGQSGVSRGSCCG